MIKKLLLLLSTSFVLTSGMAQVPTQRTCGTMEHHEFLKQTRPNYSNDLNQYNQVIEQYLQDRALLSPAARAASSIITIPVVVHVVYNGAAENITDAQAISQVQVLNNDFAKLNTDASKVTQPTFSTVASGANIRFCIAQRDPNGNATTGVVHKATTTASFATDDAVKSSATGGDDAWDVTRYVNIWVCDLTNPLLGYGEFPTASISNTWGLVIDYAYTGSGGSATPPYNLGRTGTHEFGHCFNLLHIWGDEAGCTGSDQCSDTPNQGAEHYGAFTQGSIQTDNCTTTSPGVMWMNYMDYTDDGSMYMFTAQQCARMEAVVNTAPWNVLANSNACTPVTALDAGIAAILSPVSSSSTCATAVTPVITLKNEGTTTLTSAKVLYKMDAAATQTLNWTGSLATTATTVLTLNSITGLTTAAHTFSVWVTSPNNGTDLNAANNSNTSTFNVINAPTGAVLPFTEGFESTTFPPTGWQQLRAATVSTVLTWSRLANTTGLTTGSTGVAKMTNFSTTTNITGQIDALRTPALSFAGATASTLKVKFDVSHRAYSTTTRIDTLNVYISTDCGSSWTRLYTKGGSQLASVSGALTTAYTPTANAQWRRDSISLSAYAGQASVYLKFESRSGRGNNLYLDNINVVGTTVAAAPTASFASVTSQCAGTAIALTDQSLNTPTTWAWSAPGATPATATIQNPTITYSASGTYTVTLIATNGTGASTPYTKVITINPKPTVAIASSTICSGNSATLTASGASTYVWNTGVTTSTLSNAPTVTTNYTVTGTSALSCTNIATGAITVNATPTVVATNTAVCAGNSVVLSASGASTYAWAGGPATANYNVTPTATTIYTVTGTAANTCTNTKTVSVTYNALPVTTASSATICAGSTGTITASGASTYLWNTGATSVNITASPTANTNYTVTGTSAAGCVKTATASIIVASAPAISLSSATLCAGASTVLVASGVTSYTWTAGPNTASYTVTPTATSVYTVSGNLTGCAATAVKTVTVTVNSLPSVVAASATICAGSTASLTASGASTYLWNNGIATSVNAVSPTSNTTYSVTGTSAAGCTKTVAVNVTVNSLPTLGVASTTVCAGSSATVTASGASTYLWNTGATGASLVVSPSATTNYTVTGTSSLGCAKASTVNVSIISAPVITVSSASVCSGASVLLSASGVTSYTWTAGPNTASYSVTPLATTVYTVTGNLTGCSTQAVSTATVTVNTLPVVSVSIPNNKLCVNNAAVALTGTPVGGTYFGTGMSGNTFNPALSGAGTFTVTYNYTDGNGCSGAANQIMFVDLCTGIEEINNGDLIIYPNPANETLTIKLNAGLVSTTTFELYDAIGKLVIAQKASEIATTLHLEPLANGIYTLRVLSDNSQTVRRIVKE